MNRWKRALIALGLLLSLRVGLLAWQIHQFGTNSQTTPSDVAIVLGAAVWDGQPSPIFEERIKHGITLYQEGLVEKLIFTGGIGDGDHYEPTPILDSLNCE